MAKKLTYRTEDEVRDSAKVILGFDKSEPKVKQGTGQITTLNQLGFKGVNVLYPKFEMNQYIALFIIPLLKAAGRKYAFADKWKKETMEKDTIMLPVDEKGKPDFSYMETYMKGIAQSTQSKLEFLLKV